MKKTILAVLVVAMVLLVGATTVFAAGSNAGCRLADVHGAYGDNACQYADGICSYVDADNDGVCDNYADRQGQRHGNGHGYGHGAGNGLKGGCGR